MPGRQPDVLDAVDRLSQRAGEIAVRRGELVGELVVAALESCIPLGDQHAFIWVADALDVHAKSEAVEQLRSQLTLFRIHGPDEDEARRVAEGDAFSLDDVDAHRRRVKKDIDEMVVEQVDLVDVEDVAVRLGQHAGLEAPLAGAQRGLDVDRADDTVLGGVDRQLDHPHASLVVRQCAGRAQLFPAVRAERVPVGWVAPEVAALDDVVLGKKPCQAADGGRLSSALLPANEHAANRGHDRVEDQGQLHRFLADDRRKGVRVPVESDTH